MATERQNRKRVVWGITGSGDKIVETFEVMKRIREEYKNNVEISIYMSKAAEQVVKYYDLTDSLGAVFGKLSIEKDSNTPFLAGALQLGKFAFLLIAPATSNTVAKIALGIADAMLSNAAIMALKAFVPVYIIPSDYREVIVTTRLPNGRNLRLRIRKEDAENAEKLAILDGVSTLEKPEKIFWIFQRNFKLCRSN